MRQLSVQIAMWNAGEKGQRPRGNVNENGSELCGCSPPSPSVVCFFFCVHTLLSLSSSSSLARAFSEGDTHSFSPPKQQATPPLQAVRHFSFVPWASHRVVFCCVVCVIYVTRNANTWVNMQNISQTMIWADTHICTRPLSVLHTNTSIHISVCVCANGKFGDCLQTRYVRAPNAASKAFTFLK